MNLCFPGGVVSVGILLLVSSDSSLRGWVGFKEELQRSSLWIWG
jgi:hypothetical protein